MEKAQNLQRKLSQIQDSLIGQSQIFCNIHKKISLQVTAQILFQMLAYIFYNIIKYKHNLKMASSSTFKLNQIANKEIRDSVSALMEGKKLTNESIQLIKNEYFSNAYFKVKLNVFLQKSVGNAEPSEKQNLDENQLVSLSTLIKRGNRITNQNIQKLVKTLAESSA